MVIWTSIWDGGEDGTALGNASLEMGTGEFLGNESLLVGDVQRVLLINVFYVPSIRTWHVIIPTMSCYTEVAG